jgi:hypothetical protein
MKIDIIHVRDPDSECGMTVFVDGKRVDNVAVEDIDPGRGWQRADYNDRLYDAIVAFEADESEYNQAVVAELNGAADSQGIDDDGSPDVSKMEHPVKCENADGNDPDCQVYYDQAKGDGYAGKCPHCADVSEPAEHAD